MNEHSPYNSNGNKFSTKQILINPSQRLNISETLTKNENNEVILITSAPNNPHTGTPGFAGIPPYLPIGGGAVALIVVLTAYSKSQMKSVNEFAETLLKRQKKE